MDFNPRSLTGATGVDKMPFKDRLISIHAPSRERPQQRALERRAFEHFNPRSLTGATDGRIII